MKPLWMDESLVLRRECWSPAMRHRADCEAAMFLKTGPLLYLADGSSHPPERTVGIMAHMGAGR